MSELDPKKEVAKADENGNAVHDKSNRSATEKRSLTNGDVEVLKDDAVNEVGGDKKVCDKAGTAKMDEDQVAVETEENVEESMVENKDDEKHKVDVAQRGADANKSEVTNVQGENKVDAVDAVNGGSGKEEEAEKDGTVAEDKAVDTAGDIEVKEVEDEEKEKDEIRGAEKTEDKKDKIEDDDNEGEKADDKEGEKADDKEVEKADDMEVVEAGDIEVEKTEDKEKEKAAEEGGEKTTDMTVKINNVDDEEEKEKVKEEEKVEEKDVKEANGKDEEMVNGEEKDNIEKEDEEMAEPKEESNEEHEVEQEKEDGDEKEVEMEDKEAEEEEETEKQSGVEKGSKKRARERVSIEKSKGRKKELMSKEPELKTPISDRPVRERKSVERLVASIEKDNSKGFHIEKGGGTPLKDIPNVSFKFSRRKADDTFKLLHTILFGRRGKAVDIKSNISRFSGFVWRDDEEKQKSKVREKFDKCTKEKLLEFCDLFDIPIAKATTRKEDIIVKLIDFLVSPHPTTAVLLAEKEANKGKKRKRNVKRSSPAPGRASKSKVKAQKTNEDSSRSKKDKTASDSEDESVEDDNNNEEDENGIPKKSEEHVEEHSQSEDKNDSGDESEDERKKKKNSKVSSKKKEPVKCKKTSSKSSVSSKRSSKKTSANHPKIDENDDDETCPKVFSRKKSNGKETKEKVSVPAKSAPKEKPGARAGKGKGKNKEDKLKPSNDKLRESICEILKEVDFNTATFTDILKQLAKQFKSDLTPRKSSIKLMIQEELTKLADEADDEDEGDAEKDENQGAPEVEA